jgi:hypothetical protein
MAKNVHKTSRAQSQDRDGLIRVLQQALLTTPEGAQALGAIAAGHADAPLLARQALSSILAELLNEAVSQLLPLSSSALSSKSDQGSLSDRQNEAGQLATLVGQLEDECEKLRQSLAEVKAERDLYLKAAYANARSSLQFEDQDIPELQAASDGPVEILE